MNQIMRSKGTYWAVPRLYHSFFVLLASGSNFTEQYVFVDCCEQRLFIDEHNVHAQNQRLIIPNQFYWYFNKITTTDFGLCTVVLPFKVDTSGENIFTAVSVYSTVT